MKEEKIFLWTLKLASFLKKKKNIQTNDKKFEENSENSNSSTNNDFEDYK